MTRTPSTPAGRQRLRPEDDSPAPRSRRSGRSWSASVPSAVELAPYAEQTARQLLFASLAGVPELFPEDLRHGTVRLSLTRPGGGGGAGDANSLWRQLIWEMEPEQPQVRRSRG